MTRKERFITELLNLMKLTESERKLEIAVVALKQIAAANIPSLYYHQIVDKQTEIASEALEEIGS